LEKRIILQIKILIRGGAASVPDEHGILLVKKLSPKRRDFTLISLPGIFTLKSQ